MSDYNIISAVPTKKKGTAIWFIWNQYTKNMSIQKQCSKWFQPLISWFHHVSWHNKAIESKQTERCK